MDRFAEKLELIYNAAGGKKIDLISHSMGGLLVKCFMTLHSDVIHPLSKSVLLYVVVSFNLVTFIYQNFRIFFAADM
jgi:pimeloyl-ACP methyl ester carboxylesterase